MTTPAASTPPTSTVLIAVENVLHLRLSLPPHHRWVSQLVWQPIAYSELHLCAHYFPIAIRFSRGLPLLGVMLDEKYLIRSLTDAAGTWHGGYMPMAVRSFPFQATGSDPDPLKDLVVPANTPMLSTNGVALRGKDGAPSSELKEIHKFARQLLDSRRSLAVCLDHLAVAGLLVALPASGRTGPAEQLFSIDPAKWAALDPGALAAMTRSRFATVDIAVACLFSQHLLRTECRPKALIGGAAAALTTTGPHPDYFGLDEIAIDDGELLSLDDLDVMHIGTASLDPEAEPSAHSPFTHR